VNVGPVVFDFKTSMAVQIFALHHYRRTSCDPFLWSEGMKTLDIMGRMLTQYGVNCTVQKNVVDNLNMGGKLLIMKNDQTGFRYN